MALSLQRYTWSDFESGLNRMVKERFENERKRSTVIAIKIGDVLPENLIIEILSWLPVKALLQFKSVCKSWYAIISSPDFISKHLKNYYYNNSNDSGCLLAQYYVSHAELQLFELFVDETPTTLAYEVLYSMPMYGSYICGPCDGLYYLYNYDYGDRALWNPAINELRSLPPLINKPDFPPNKTYAMNEVYGFGLDPLTRDYKVVVIKGYWSKSDEDEEDTETKPPLAVLVYSLRTDSWKYCGDLTQDYDLENNKCYVFVKGCYYWLGSSPQHENSGVIVSFDMATDAFEELHLPDYEQPASNSLGIYCDSLAFLSVHENEKRFDIWTLSEEGQGVWTKKFSMGGLSDIRNPVGHCNNNNMVFEHDDGSLVLCNPDTQELKNLGFQRDMWCKGIFGYKESLVSINNQNKLGQREEAEGVAVQV